MIRSLLLIRWEIHRVYQASQTCACYFAEDDEPEVIIRYNGACP